MNIPHSLYTLYSVAEAQAIYRMVLELRFGLSLADLVLGKDKHLSKEDADSLAQIIARIAKGEPVQYVLGVAEFCGRQFAVAPGVLIPRVETQQLVEMASQAPLGSSVLDMGTGSGCIAITLALAGYQVSALDISAQALDMARQNAETLGASVHFFQHDMLQPLHTHQHWDIIVSNPPYVCQSEESEMHTNVLHHEPAQALFVPDATPLLFYQAIANFALQHLNPGGRLCVEANRRYASQVGALFAQQGFAEVQVTEDIFQNPRFVSCTR